MSAPANHGGDANGRSARNRAGILRDVDCIDAVVGLAYPQVDRVLTGCGYVDRIHTGLDAVAPDPLVVVVVFERAGQRSVKADEDRVTAAIITVRSIPYVISAGGREINGVVGAFSDRRFGVVAAAAEGVARAVVACQARLGQE